MNIKRTGENEYSLEGLTAGKLLAIKNTLSNEGRSAVAYDILVFLNNNLEKSLESEISNTRMLIVLGAGVIQEIFTNQNVEINVMDNDINDYDEDLLFEYSAEANPEQFLEAVKDAEKMQADWELERGKVNDN